MLWLSYDGTNYHGWQIQKNAETVQGILTKAIRETVGHEVYLSGCGRTDAGVHAKIYAANFKGENPVPMNKMPMALNAKLPDDISIKKAQAVTDDFDARFSCVEKEYTYVVHNAEVRDPFLRTRAWFYPYELDIEAMKKAAKHFIGEKDFAAVRSQGTPVKSTVRTMYECEVETRGDLIMFRMRANGFLYNMARAITGTIMYVGRGKLSEKDIPDILKNGYREEAGPTAPPNGLYMTGVSYDEVAF